MTATEPTTACPRCNGKLSRRKKRIEGHVVLGCTKCGISAIEERWPEWIAIADPRCLDRLQGIADTIDYWNRYMDMTLADESWD